MKRGELTSKQKLSVPCPVCAAAIGEHCKLYSGLGRRNEPHAERKYQAVHDIEQRLWPTRQQKMSHYLKDGGARILAGSEAKL
jgi:hypothetical protein